MRPACDMSSSNVIAGCFTYFLNVSVLWRVRASLGTTRFDLRWGRHECSSRNKYNFGMYPFLIFVRAARHTGRRVGSRDSAGAWASVYLVDHSVCLDISFRRQPMAQVNGWELPERSGRQRFTDQNRTGRSAFTPQPRTCLAKREDGFTVCWRSGRQSWNSRLDSRIRALGAAAISCWCLVQAPLDFRCSGQTPCQFALLDSFKTENCFGFPRSADTLWNRYNNFRIN